MLIYIDRQIDDLHIKCSSIFPHKDCKKMECGLYFVHAKTESSFGQVFFSNIIIIKKKVKLIIRNKRSGQRSNCDEWFGKGQLAP